MSGVGQVTHHLGRGKDGGGKTAGFGASAVVVRRIIVDGGGSAGEEGEAVTYIDAYCYDAETYKAIQGVRVDFYRQILYYETHIGTKYSNQWGYAVLGNIDTGAAGWWVRATAAKSGYRGMTTGYELCVGDTKRFNCSMMPLPKVRTLSIMVSPMSGYVGDTFTFSGHLTENGSPVAGVAVRLVKEGYGVVGSGVTGGDGRYSIGWTANAAGLFGFHMEE